jgi:hypothetical protein
VAQAEPAAAVPPVAPTPVAATNGSGASHPAPSVRAAEGKLIRFPASPARRDDDLASEPPSPPSEPVPEPEIPRREPAAVRRIEREPSEPPPPPTEPAPVARVAEPKPGAQTLIGGTASLMQAAEASSSAEERTSGVLPPAEPSPVNWPTLDREEEEEPAPRSQPHGEELHDEFFSAGEEGLYEGGPASLIPDATEELEHESLDTIPALRPRTPAQEQRRRNFIMVVAGVIGFGLAVAGFGIYWSMRRSHSAEPPVASEPAAQAPGEARHTTGSPEPLIPAPPTEAATEPDLPAMALPEGTTEPSRAPAAAGTPPAPGAGPASPAAGPAPTLGAHPGGPATAPGQSPPSGPARPNNPVTGRPPTASFPIE